MKKLALNWLLFSSYSIILLLCLLLLFQVAFPPFKFILVLTLILITVSIFFYSLLAYKNEMHYYTNILNEIKKGHSNIDFNKTPNPTFTNFQQQLEQAFIEINNRLQLIAQARDEKQEILSSMTEGIITVDLDFRITSINKAAIELLGYNQTVVLVGRPVKEAVKNKDIRQLINDTLVGKAPQHDLFIIKVKNSYFQTHSTLLKDYHGIATGVLVVLNDVSRLKHLERVRTDFVANVSHELRTPITLIMTTIETLQTKQDVSQEKAERFINIIQNHAERLNAILEDLLILSRLEHAPEEEDFRLDNGSLNQLVKKAVFLCEPKAIQHNIMVKLDFNQEYRVNFNEALLEQALINLIDNAIKYSDKDKIVSISLKGTEKYLEIAVTDQGSGIPEKHLDRIFERFYRVDKARSRKIGGTGLGLSIVKHIAQVHSGYVSVVSKVGEGSTFSIYLPI